MKKSEKYKRGFTKLGYKVHVKRFLRKPIEITFEDPHDAIKYLCALNKDVRRMRITFRRISVHQVIITDGLANYFRPGENTCSEAKK